MLVPEIFEPFLSPMRYKVAYGGRGSGKSWSIARLLVEFSRRARIRILCARELQSSISDSVIQLLADTIERNGYLDEFEILKTEIVHKTTKSRFMFYGIRHNITKIKSIEGVDICWIEEAENVSEESWVTLIPTMRKDHSEIWISFNPKNILDPTYRRFVENPPDDCISLKVNYMDNPEFPEVLRIEMEECKLRDPEMYRHIWLGEPIADSERAFIKPAWIESAIDAHIYFDMGEHGMAQFGYDVADEGEDASAGCYRVGSIVKDLMEWSRAPQEQCSRNAYSYSYLNDADILVYDSIGVGAGAKIEFKRLNEGNSNKVKTIGWVAGGKVKLPNAEYMAGTGKKNKDMFANVKAQEWWAVRERFRNTWLARENGMAFDHANMISIPSKLPHLKKLMAELSRPMIEYDNNGRVLVESKLSMRKRKIPSPNLADALILAFCRASRGGSGLIC